MSIQLQMYERTASGPNGFLPLNSFSYFPWDTRSIICLGGIDAYTQVGSNGYAKFAGSILTDDTIKRYEPRLFSAVYPPEFETYTKEIKALSEAGNPQAFQDKLPDIVVAPAKKMAKELVEHLFIPCIDEAKKQKNPYAILCDRFKHQTFFAHSFGTYMLPHIDTGLRSELEKAGFDDKQTGRLMRQIHVITTGEMGLWHEVPKEGMGFTVLHGARLSDQLIQQNSAIAGADDGLLRQQKNRHNGLFINADGGDSVGGLQSVHASHTPKAYEMPEIKQALNNAVGRGGNPVRNIGRLLRSSTRAMADDSMPPQRFVADKWPENWADLAIQTSRSEKDRAP